jgi:hypothetical protein
MQRCDVFIFLLRRPKNSNTGDGMEREAREAWTKMT